MDDEEGIGSSTGTATSSPLTGGDGEGLARGSSGPRGSASGRTSFDPSGLEFLRRAVEHVVATTKTEAVAAGRDILSDAGTAGRTIVA